MKKIFVMFLTLVMGSTLFIAPTTSVTEARQNNATINVVSREEGSGTRGAFIELFGLEERIDGRRRDLTTRNAIIANQTNIVLRNIANDANAIGYVSLGSLNNTVKALQIDGVAPTPANIKNGTYKAFRPFNIATKGVPTGLTKDFIDFILSAEGQAVVVANGYIAVGGDLASYSGTRPSGRITVGGSTSVNPIMEKLKEAYIKINPNATIEIQMTDSTTGINGVINGIVDIGMASRAMRDSEKQQLRGIEMAYDGLAIIVNNRNPITGMTSADVKNIFVGQTTRWNDVTR